LDSAPGAATGLRRDQNEHFKASVGNSWMVHNASAWSQTRGIVVSICETKWHCWVSRQCRPFEEVTMAKCVRQNPRFDALITLALGPSVFCVLAQPAPCNEPPKAHDDMLQFILEANRAHCQKFPFMAARFREFTGSAASWQDAIEGRFLPEPKPVVCNIFWAFDGENFRRDEIFAPEDIKRFSERRGRLTTYRYQNNRGLWNSTLDLYLEHAGHFTIHRRGHFGLEGWQPFNIGMGLPLYQHVPRILKFEEGRARYVGERELDGRRVPVLETSFRETNGTTRQLDRYWIDPERGYIPIRVETYFNDKLAIPALLIVIREFRSIGNGIWFPSLARFTFVSPGTVDHVSEWQLVDVDIENRPAPDVFSYGVPQEAAPGTELFGTNDLTREKLEVHKGRISLAYFHSDGRLREDQQNVTVRPSPGSSRAGGATSVIRSQESTVPIWPFARADSRSPWEWVALFVLLVLLVALLLWLRAWRRGHPMLTKQ
jgi:hypothetical protein